MNAMKTTRGVMGWGCWVDGGVTHWPQDSLGEELWLSPRHLEGEMRGGWNWELLLCQTWVLGVLTSSKLMLQFVEGGEIRGVRVAPREPTVSQPQLRGSDPKARASALPSLGRK